MHGKTILMAVVVLVMVGIAFGASMQSIAPTAHAGSASTTEFPLLDPVEMGKIEQFVKHEFIKWNAAPDDRTHRKTVVAAMGFMENMKVRDFERATMFTNGGRMDATYLAGNYATILCGTKPLPADYTIEYNPQGAQYHHLRGGVLAILPFTVQNRLVGSDRCTRYLEISNGYDNARVVGVNEKEWAETFLATGQD